MSKLTANVVLAHPDNGEPVLLAEGSELPEWAFDLVGEHVLDEPPGPAEAPKKKRSRGAASKSADDESTPPVDWSKVLVPDLQAEIGRRNAEREEDAQLSAEGLKDDLVKVLTDDDAASA